MLINNKLINNDQNSLNLMERNDPVQKLLALDNDSNLNMRYYDED